MSGDGSDVANPAARGYSEAKRRKQGVTGRRVSAAFELYGINARPLYSDRAFSPRRLEKTRESPYPDIWDLVTLVEENIELTTPSTPG